MSIYASIVKLLLKVVDGIVGYLQNRQLIKAGEAKAMNTITQKVMQRIQDAKNIRRNANGLDDDLLLPPEKRGRNGK